MNVCLLISYFSTNNSIIITKRTSRNFISQLSLVFGNFIATNSLKHSNFHRKSSREITILGRNYLKNVFPPPPQTCKPRGHTPGAVCARRCVCVCVSGRCVCVWGVWWGGVVCVCGCVCVCVCVCDCV